MNKTWVEFLPNYSICKETCEAKSHARTYYANTFKRNVPEKVLKVNKQGYVKCGLHMVSVKKKYIEACGEEYKEVLWNNI